MKIKDPETLPNNAMSLVLDGNVFFVEKDKNGKVISQSEIDGNVVLEILMGCLEEAIMMDLATLVPTKKATKKHVIEEPRTADEILSDMGISKKRAKKTLARYENNTKKASKKKVVKKKVK